MLEELKQLYSEAGKAIVGALPAGWQTTWTLVEMDSADQGAVACFVQLADGSGRYVKAPITAYRAFAMMWKLARAADGEKSWTSLTFIVHAGGRFDVKYGFDPVPIEDEPARRKAWERLHGLSP